MRLSKRDKYTLTKPMNEFTENELRDKPKVVGLKPHKLFKSYR